VHRARFAREVSEDRLDHHRIFDARDDAHRAAAARAGLDVDAEHALQALCPAHRGAPLGRRSRLGPGRTCPALAPPSIGDQCAVRTVGCEHAVVAGENVCGAVAVGAFEPFVVNVRAGDAAAQAFEFLALMGASRESNYLANGRFGHTPAARLRIRQMAAAWNKAGIPIL